LSSSTRIAVGGDLDPLEPVPSARSRLAEIFCGEMAGSGAGVLDRYFAGSIRGPPTSIEAPSRPSSGTNDFDLYFAVSLSQLLLCLVFTVAGLAKLADREGTRQALEAFGVSPRLAVPGAVVLPLVELAIAAALVPSATARSAASAAFVSLVIFSVAVARSLWKGAAPDCNCFGGLSQTQVGRGTLLRNLLLGTVAGFVVLGGQSAGPLDWVIVPARADRPWIAILLACSVGLGWFCWQLLRQNGRLLASLDASGPDRKHHVAEALSLPPLGAGTLAPAFSGRDLNGEPVSLESLLARGLPVTLFFTDPGCGACELVLGDVSRSQREHSAELTVAVISGGSIDRIEQKAAQFGLDLVVPQDDHEVLDAYRVHGFPGVAEIDRQGLLRGPVALGPDAVRRAVLGTANDPLPDGIGRN
jgi:peroxiredoxin